MGRRAAMLLVVALAAPPIITNLPTVVADETAPFTLVVVPDTQHYAESDAGIATLTTQLNWITGSRSELNTQFVIQLGDLVDRWNDSVQWQRIDTAFGILDQAQVPYAVNMGNHDFQVSGAAPYFDQHFPPSRFAGAAWNSETVSYGGYLGQNRFGADPIDRQNKDSYALLTTGGMKLLLIQLEFDLPQYSLDWAQKVIDAYPDRQVILSTHGFINTAGTRSNTVIRTDTEVNTANQAWQKLTYPNCNIFLVLNGHWSDGELGEARRTDPNACGHPVHQILTDFQGRPNAGDGWLRYYTIDPAADTIDAHTYSPKLDRFETDDSSRFTVVLPTTGDTAAPVTLVSDGTNWSYRYQGGTWPVGWQQPEFDDGEWTAAQAPLGFGSTSVRTNIDVPPPTSNRPRTALFRHVFTVQDVGELSDVVVTTRADDGVAVWVNGTEVGRKNLPTGSLSAATYATAAPRTSAATAQPAVFEVPASLLAEGTNVIASSNHHNYRGTPDISFDATVTAMRAGDDEPPDPVAPAAPTMSAEATGAGVALSWEPGDAAVLSGFRVMRDGQELAGVGAAVRQFQDSEVEAGASYEYGVIAVGANGLSSPAATRGVTVPEGPGGDPVAVTLVASGSSWRWLFRSAGWPAGWNDVGFDDGSWSIGVAPLGWGTAGIATNIDVPLPTSNRPRTALFRHVFTVQAVGELSDVMVTTRADDGVAVWVNGTEVGRKNLPSGSLSASTYATAVPRTSSAVANPAVFDIPMSLLREGQNVITSSNHHNYRGTPDISFEATLTATRVTD